MSLKLESTEGKVIEAQGLKDGTLITTEWVQAQVVKGNVYHAYVGTATTPVTLDASYANTDPDISLDIRTGRLIIPLVIKVVVEAYGTTALFEAFTLCTPTLANSSAGTQFTPINYRTRKGGGSAAKVYIGPTVTSGAGTNGAFELHRWSQAKAVTIATADDDSTWQPEEFVWSYKKDGLAPILEGDASMQTWVVCQASSGYIQYVWAELGSDEI